MTRDTYAYVNGDPINLSDPTGHSFTTGCDEGGYNSCSSSSPPTLTPCEVKGTCATPPYAGPCRGCGNLSQSLVPTHAPRTSSGGALCSILLADLCSLSDPATARLQYHEFLLSHGCFDELHPSNICKELVGFDTFVAIVGTVIGGEAGGSEEAGAEAETAALSRFARGLAEPVSGETFDVVADPRKFSEYLLTPNASGRFQQLLKLGYQQGDVGAARTLSDAITQQAADAISAQDFQFAGLTNDGRFLRINLNVTIPGTGSAAGKSYTFTSGWYLDEDTGAFTFSTLLPPK